MSSTSRDTESSGIRTAIGEPALPPMWFVIPDGFHALPIDADPDDRAAAATEFTRGLFPEGNTQLWESAAPFYAGLTGMFTEVGIAYSALGVFSDDNGGIVHCSLIVGAIESSHTRDEEAVEGIEQTLARDSLSDSRRIALPCGPAVSNITLREVTIGAELTSTGEEAKLLTGQIQVFVPFPQAPFIAVFTLDTAAMDHWAEICDMTAAILRTVSLTAPA